MMPAARFLSARRWWPALALGCALQCAAPLAAGQETAAPAGDAPGPPAAAPPAAEPRAALLARRDAAQATFLRLTDEQRHEEAAALAAEVLALTVEAFGERSIETATPLTNLATTELRRGDLVAAERHYQSAIGVIERNEGLASPRLVNPLVGLGETYARGGLYEQARDAYERALRTNHAELGFYNLEQMKIMDGLSEAYLGLDKLEQANVQQRTQVAIQRRRSGAGSPEVVSALYKLGRWLNRTGQYAESREVYQAARRLLREANGPDDPAMVDALLGEALTYTNEGAIPAAASTLKRALDLLDAQPERDRRKRAEVLVSLGDLYVLSRQPRAARQRYGQAWQELSGEPGLEEQRAAYFDNASRISGPRLPDVVTGDGKPRTGAPADAAALAPGMVLAEMTVDAGGEARGLKIIESDPPGLLDERVLRALDSTAFRPRLVDGEPVDSAGVQFRHDFRYVRTAPAAEPPAPPDDAPAGERGERIGYPEQPDAGDAAGGR